MLLLSGADQSLVNNDGRSPLSVASCPNNPCTNPELEKVVKLLNGEIPLGDCSEGSSVTGGASKGLFKSQDNRILSVKIKAPAKPASMSCGFADITMSIELGRALARPAVGAELGRALARPGHTPLGRRLALPFAFHIFLLRQIPAPPAGALAAPCASSALFSKPFNTRSVVLS